MKIKSTLVLISLSVFIIGCDSKEFKENLQKSTEKAKSLNKVYEKNTKSLKESISKDVKSITKTSKQAYKIAEKKYKKSK